MRYVPLDGNHNTLATSASWQITRLQRFIDMMLVLQSFERSPANLVRMDKDNFVLTVPGEDPLAEGMSPEQLQELEQDPHEDQQVMQHF